MDLATSSSTVWVLRTVSDIAEYHSWGAACGVMFRALVFRLPTLITYSSMSSARFTSGPATVVRKVRCSAGLAVVLNVARSAACSDSAVVSACSSSSANSCWLSALKRMARCWVASSWAVASALSVWTPFARPASAVPCAIWAFRDSRSPMGVE